VELSSGDAQREAHPPAWLAFTLPRGVLTGFPFVDAGALGYGQVALNCVVIGLFFTALAAGAFRYDRRFTRLEPA
jgi:hypothetical protein